MITIADLRQKFEALQIRRVKVGAFDIDGILRGKYISLERFSAAAESGLGFCDVLFGWDIGDALLDKLSYTGWHTSYPDTLAIIDLDSFRTIPWEPGTAFFLLDFLDKDRKPLAISPRQLFRSVLKIAEDRGYKAHFAAEFEFWLFKESPETLRAKGFRGLTPLSPGSFGYSLLRASQNSELVMDIIENLHAFDVPLEGFHTETGPGVYEAALAVDIGLRAADKAALFKAAIKEIAARHALTPTFMAKWSAELAGSGGHIHQSLWTDETNIFFEGEARAHYIAGLTAHLPELMCMMCPSINSYKRMVPGTWAPVNATWGEDTRTTAVRSISGGEKASRVELRLSGADINPYIAMAASLAAGLEGMERKMTAPAPSANGYAPGSGAPLPKTLAEAVKLFRDSALARKWFGDQFVDHYAATREWEVRQFDKAVTDWELARYFESI